MKRRIYFRADAGKEIGYGHFIRTLALADMLKDDFDCVFVTQAPTDYQKAEVAKVCQLVELPATDEKFSLFLDMLHGDEIVVLDNYFYGTEYQQAIKGKGCKLVCIDDMHDKHYVADVVINHGLSNKKLFDVEPYTRLCLGYCWALLRKPFYESILQRKEISDIDSLKILLCFGGVDSFRLTEKFARLLLAWDKKCEITAILGDGYLPDSEISTFPINILKNIPASEMANLFSSCDLAILPASTVSLEALSRHSKIAAGYYVDNQKEIYEEYVSRNKIIPLGDLKNVDWHKLSLEAIWGASKNLDVMDDFSSIPFNYRALFHSISGIKDYELENLIFRDYRTLNENSHKEIWKARNDDAVRCWMESPCKISWESHLDFIKKLSSSSNKIYWGIYEDKTFLGSVNVRFIDSCRVERGIFVATQYENKSWGSRIEMALFKLLQAMRVKFIVAKVLRDNSRSIHFHEKMGYKSMGQDEKFEYFKKELEE